MPKFGRNEDTFLLNLSSLWRTLFKDTATLQTLYRGSETLLGENYLDILSEAISLRLSTTPVFEKDYWRTLYFSAGDLDIRDIGGGQREFAFPLDEEIIDFQYLQNRLSSPSLVLEKDREFRFESDVLGTRLVFNDNPLETAAVLTNFVQRDSQTLHTGTDGLVSSGIPNEHLPADPTARVAAINARYELRRTFTTRGVLYTIRDAQHFEGKESWIEVDLPIFSPASIGHKINVPSPAPAQEHTITFVVSSTIAIVDSPFVGLPALFDLEVRNDNLFQDEHLGFEVVIDDVTTDDNDGTYTIIEVLSGTEARLNRGFTFDDPTVPTYTSVTRAATVFSIPTADTRFILNDVGKYLFVSDGSSNTGWFKITAVGTFNANDFAEDITVSDPDTVLPGFDASGITASLHTVIQQSQGLVWVLQTPSVVGRAKMYAPDVSVETHTLRERFGVLVGRKEDSSERYKSLLQGIYQYFWAGPTLFNLESALNTMVGFPVIELEGELLIRVEETATNDTVVTDNREYVFSAGFVKDALKDTSAWSSKVFRRLESLTNVFIIEDVVSDPTWYYNLLLPEVILPEEPEARRLITPRLQQTSYGADWNYGDPGVFYGAQLQGEPFPDNVISGRDFFISGTAITTHKTRLFAEYGGKTVYVVNRQRKIALVTGENSAELNIPLETPLIAAFQHTGVTAGGDNFITITTYEFNENDIGRALNHATLGLFFVDTIVSSHVIGVVDINDAVPSLGAATELVTLAFDAEIINRQPLHPTVGFAVATGYAKANMFGLRYEFDDTAFNFADLQDDIRDIIEEGKPAHVLLLNQPWQALSDICEVFDAVTSIGFSFPDGDGMPLLSRPLTYDGTWDYGDYFFLANGYVTWEQRLSFTEVSSLPSDIVDGSGDQFHAVLDARTSEEIWMVPSINFGGNGQLFGLDVYAWNDVSNTFINTGLSFDFDTDNLTAEKISLGGLFLAFLLTYNTGTDVSFTVGTRRNSVVEHRGTTNHPSGVGTIAVGADTLVDTSFDFFPLDVGREVFLEFFNGLSLTVARTRLVRIDTSDSVGLIDADTGLAFVAPVSSVAVTWRFGVQKRWGQTAMHYGGMLMPSLSPPIGVGVNDGYGVEQPVQVTIRDTLSMVPIHFLRPFMFGRNPQLFVTS